jgi:hypothetical protein
MLCPATDPAAVEKQEDDGLFELAPDVTEKKPAPRRNAGQAPLEATAAAMGVLPYRSHKAEEKASGEPNQLMDLWAPLFLIVAAIAGQALAAFIKTRGNPASLSTAMTAVTIDMAFGTAFMMLGMWLAAKSRKIDLGGIATAIFKLAAIAVAPSAAIELLSIPLKIIPLFGWLFAWVIGFMLYFALIGTLFDLDQDDTWYCVKVIFFVKIITALAFIFGIAALIHTQAS